MARFCARAVLALSMYGAAFSSVGVQSRQPALARLEVGARGDVQQIADSQVAALAGQESHEHAHVQRAGVKEISCQCEAWSTSWAAPAARAPTLVYFDLGANRGDTFPPRGLLAKHLSEMMETTKLNWTCDSDHALLFEANEAFADELKKKGSMCPSGVKLFTPSAVANCDGRAKLYASKQKEGDVGSTTRHDKTFDVQYNESYDIAAVNLMRVLHENTLEEDKVVIKMDIEGGEFDIMPCLAESPLASRIDFLLLERHDKMMSLDEEVVKVFNASVEQLRAQGVNVDDSWI